MNIALLGYGEQGRAALEYWNKPENLITVCDANPDLQLPDSVQAKLGADYLQDLEQFDLLVRTPSLHPDDIREANPDHPEIFDKITTVTNEFFRVCPAPIIGITGTKGKGTTSTLITQILKAAGKTVHLGGNIGIAPLDMLKNNIQSSDIVVLELANFQLIDLKYSPAIAVCLLVVPEHLNWHKNLYEYIHAKQQMFVHQNHNNLAVYNARSEFSEEVATASHAPKLTYDVPPKGEEPLFTDGTYVEGEHIKMQGKTICSVHDVALLGRHNLQNACAAIAAVWDLIEHNKKPIKTVLKQLKGLPNRLEPVRTVNRITYYNDSFATGPGATIAAIEAIPGHKVLIIGGFDRKLPMEELVDTMLRHQKDIRKVVLIGASARRVASVCQDKGFTNFEVAEVKTMQEIIRVANEYARKGDSIVLSPGFPSFDMFKNFEDRGEQFRQNVLAL